MSIRIVTLLSLLALAVAAAGCSAPSATNDPPANDVLDTAGVKGGGGGTGGNVRDAPGKVASLAADRTSGDNSGSTVVTFSGAAFDANGENDLDSITITTAAGAPLALGSTRIVKGADRSVAAEPAEFGADGWKVWTGSSAKDGTLHFQFRLPVTAFTPAGSYVFTASVANGKGVTGGLQGAGPTLVLSSFSSIVVAPAPVDLAGASLAGTSWGGWDAAPGDANVEAANFLKLVNEGDLGAAEVVIDFSEAAFTGASDANFTIPIDGNVQFRFCDVASAAVAPGACGLGDWAPASGDGSVKVTFGGKGHVIYVTYRIVQMPPVVPAQAYGATFTVTEL